MKKYLGIDLGGTNVRVALVDESGTVLDKREEMTEIEKGIDQVIDKIIRMMKDLDLSDCLGAGVAVAGPVDEEKGVMLLASNLPGFENYPMIDRLKEDFDLPMFLINDGNAAGLAEAVVGAGAGYKNCVYVTISTGIGAAIVLDGMVYGGSRGYAGEVGNIILDRSKQRINNMAPGATESEASGTALVRKAKEIDSLKHIKHAGELFDLSKSNDNAKQLIDEFIEDIAQMLAAVGHIVDPNVFVFGGGVMKSKEYFFDQVYETYQSFVHPQMRDVLFVEASLVDPGIVGAAMQAKSKLDVK